MPDANGGLEEGFCEAVRIRSKGRAVDGMQPMMLPRTSMGVGYTRHLPLLRAVL